MCKKCKFIYKSVFYLHFYTSQLFVYLFVSGGKAYANQLELERHETQQHSQDDLCQKCKKHYLDLLTLNEHLKLCLEDPNDFKCKHCDSGVNKVRFIIYLKTQFFNDSNSLLIQLFVYIFTDMVFPFDVKKTLGRNSFFIQSSLQYLWYRHFKCKLFRKTQKGCTRWTL